MLRAVDCLSVEETAEVLQIPAQTVKTRLLRARRRLQAILAPILQDALRGAFPFAGEKCEALTSAGEICLHAVVITAPLRVLDIP
jgi:RNA polymerase sigma-70 factor (ECF subfamily)